jgi:MOSC domain-containing protein YiiM
LPKLLALSAPISTSSTGHSRDIMKLLSVNVGLPREVSWQGKLVTTGIFKEPVPERVFLRKLNLEGDRQADLTVHGGPSKAVYAYPSEHYAYWRTELRGVDLPWGMFGENFTTEGLLEDSVYIGARFGVGEAEVMVTEPRMPCYKLGLKFGDPGIIKRFLASRRTGFYFAVVREGMVSAGDFFQLISQEQQEISVADVTRLYALDRDDVESLQRALTVEALPESWKGYFRHQLEKQRPPDDQ